MLGRALVHLYYGMRGWTTVDGRRRALTKGYLHEESPTPKVVLKIGNKRCDKTESKVAKRRGEMR